MLVEILETIETKKATLQPGQRIDIPDNVVAKLGDKVRPLTDTEPDWQGDFCTACGDFNEWRGQCPIDLDSCLLTRILEADNVDQLRGLEIGQGITTDMVIDAWVGSGEPPEILLAKPTWFVCMAEYLFNTNGR